MPNAMIIFIRRVTERHTTLSKSDLYHRSMIYISYSPVSFDRLEKSNVKWLNLVCCQVDRR